MTRQGSCKWKSVSQRVQLFLNLKNPEKRLSKLSPSILGISLGQFFFPSFSLHFYFKSKPYSTGNDEESKNDGWLRSDTNLLSVYKVSSSYLNSRGSLCSPVFALLFSFRPFLNATDAFRSFIWFTARTTG